MIAYSGSFQNMIENPQTPYQWSHFDAGEPAHGERGYFEVLSQALPDNLKVLHAPPRMNPSHFLEFLNLVEQRETSSPVVVHPNAWLVEMIEKLDIRDKEWLCFENFPLSSKKALRSPIDLLAWTQRRGFGLCYDYAHVDSPTFKSFDFLKYYLKQVSVIHFSGWGHTLLTEEDWKLWRNLLLNSPASFEKLSCFVLEHRSPDDKRVDGKKLQDVLKKAAHRFKQGARGDLEPATNSNGSACQPTAKQEKAR